MPKDLSIDKPLDKHLKPVKDSDGTMSALEISTDKVKVNELEISGEAKGQTPTANDGLATKQYVDDNSGGVAYWNQMVVGFKLNNNSTSNYYTFHRLFSHSWTNSDSSPTSISSSDSYASFFISPRAGTLTNVKMNGIASDSGNDDPFKFYFFKGTGANNLSSVTLTAIATTSTITPGAGSGRQWVHTQDFSSSNSFDEGDALYIFLKKDSTSGNQDLYFSINVSGEYS